MNMIYKLDGVSKNLIAITTSETGVPLNEINCGKITDIMNKLGKYEELQKNVKIALDEIDTLLKEYEFEFEEEEKITIEAVVQSYCYLADILNGMPCEELDKKYNLESKGE